MRRRVLAILLSLIILLATFVVPASALESEDEHDHENCTCLEDAHPYLMKARMSLWSDKEYAKQMVSCFSEDDLAMGVVEEEPEKGQVCCDPSTMRKVTLVQEIHKKVIGSTACMVSVYHTVVCTYCGAIWSDKLVSSGFHIHP